MHNGAQRGKVTQRITKVSMDMLQAKFDFKLVLI